MKVEDKERDRSRKKLDGKQRKLEEKGRGEGRQQESYIRHS